MISTGDSGLMLIDRASPYEPHLVPATLDARFLAGPSDAPDRRPRLRQRCPRRTSDDPVRHRDDRGTPAGSTVRAGWPCAPSRAPALEDRTALRVAPQLASSRHALGTSCRQLPGPAASRLRQNPPQAFMR